jgi:hypothetical protein
MTLAPPAPPRPPYAFAGPYAGCDVLPEVAMDRRHVFTLHGVLRCWPFISALEIGSFQGASSTAFVEAINSGEGLGEAGVATFCDVSVTDSLLDVAANCRDPARVRVTPQPSWAVLDSALDFDFVFVDGAHDLQSVTLEANRLLRRRPLCVMAHDTSATAAGYSRCEGAAMLRRTFLNTPGYYCWEDDAARPGERTDRGLFLATTDEDLHRRARCVFERWGK